MAIHKLLWFGVGAVVLSDVSAVRTSLRDGEDELGQHRERENADESSRAMAQAEEVCTEDVINYGCDYLNVSAGGLAEALVDGIGINQRQASRFLDFVGLNSDDGCEDLCTAVVSLIPSKLGLAIPNRTQEACLSSDCTERMDVSNSALREVGLKFETPNVSDSVIRVNTSRVFERVEIGPHRMLRHTLSIVYSIFPQLNEDSDDTDGPADVPDEVDGPSLVQDDADPTFGSRIRTDRYSQYRQYVATAHANVASTIRKLPSAGTYVTKWLRASSSSLPTVTQQARWHLTEILDVLEAQKIVKGPECGQNVLAYVRAFVSCTWTDWSVCSSKDDGRFVTNICEHFWRFPDATKVGTMVHEASHHFGTDDVQYCSSGSACLSLGQSQAQNNADSYSHMVMDVIADSSLAETGAPERPPCQDGSSTGYSGSGGPIRCNQLSSYSSLSCSIATVKQNCRKTCNNCPSPSPSPRRRRSSSTPPSRRRSPSPPSRRRSPSPSPSPSGCSDNADSGFTDSATKEPVSCSDVVNQYGISCDHSSHGDKLKENCRQTCGLCSGCVDGSPGFKDTSTQRSLTCDEVINGGYNIGCDHAQYGDRMKERCAKSCGTCSGGGGGVATPARSPSTSPEPRRRRTRRRRTTTPAPTPTATPSPSGCRDVKSASLCEIYADFCEYSWAKADCARTCNACSSSARFQEVGLPQPNGTTTTPADSGLERANTTSAKPSAPTATTTTTATSAKSGSVRFLGMLPVLPAILGGTFLTAC